jgi:hypothetical protein
MSLPPELRSGGAQQPEPTLNSNSFMCHFDRSRAAAERRNLHLLPPSVLEAA